MGLSYQPHLVRTLMISRGPGPGMPEEHCWLAAGWSLLSLVHSNSLLRWLQALLRLSPSLSWCFLGTNQLERRASLHGSCMTSSIAYIRLEWRSNRSDRRELTSIASNARPRSGLTSYQRQCIWRIERSACSYGECRSRLAWLSCVVDDKYANGKSLILN